MERRLHFNIVLSLEEITLRRVVACFWNGSIFDIRQDLRYVWDIFEGDVKDKVSKFKLLESFQNRTMNLVRPIGSDILNWYVFHKYKFFDEQEVFNLHILQHLQRSGTGLIDYRRTAEEIVRHEMFDVKKCYKLACLYCLEEKIPPLWEKLPEEEKENLLISASTVCMDELKCYWVYFLKGDEFILDRIRAKRSTPLSFYCVAFEFSARRGNKPATEYFFQKLTEEERESSLILRVVDALMPGRYKPLISKEASFPTEKIFGVLCYLLSVMTSEQQMQVLRNYPLALSICLLDWSFESIFSDIADLCWSFLPEENKILLLFYINVNIRKSGCYAPIMFQKFFLSSPRDFRKLFVEQECRSLLFSEFLHAEDVKTVKVILRNIDAADRARLVFCEQVSKTLSHLILIGKWHIVEVCLREVTFSKEDRETLKRILRHVTSIMSREIPAEWRRQKLERCFEFLNEIDPSSANKRSAGDETPTRIKKFCSGEENNVRARN